MPIIFFANEGEARIYFYDRIDPDPLGGPLLGRAAFSHFDAHNVIVASFMIASA